MPSSALEERLARQLRSLPADASLPDVLSETTRVRPRTACPPRSSSNGRRAACRYNLDGIEPRGAGARRSGRTRIPGGQEGGRRRRDRRVDAHPRRERKGRRRRRRHLGRRGLRRGRDRGRTKARVLAGDEGRKADPGEDPIHVHVRSAGGGARATSRVHRHGGRARDDARHGADSVRGAVARRAHRDQARGGARRLEDDRRGGCLRRRRPFTRPLSRRDRRRWLCALSRRRGGLFANRHGGHLPPFTEGRRYRDRGHGQATAARGDEARDRRRRGAHHPRDERRRSSCDREHARRRTSTRTLRLARGPRLGPERHGHLRRWNAGSDRVSLRRADERRAERCARKPRLPSRELRSRVWARPRRHRQRRSPLSQEALVGRPPGRSPRWPPAPRGTDLVEDALPRGDAPVVGRFMVEARAREPGHGRDRSARLLRRPAGPRARRHAVDDGAPRSVRLERSTRRDPQRTAVRRSHHPGLRVDQVLPCPGPCRDAHRRLDPVAEYPLVGRGPDTHGRRRSLRGRHDAAARLPLRCPDQDLPGLRDHQRHRSAVDDRQRRAPGPAAGAHPGKRRRRSSADRPGRSRSTRACSVRLPTR